MASISLKTVTRKPHSNIFVTLERYINEAFANVKNTKIHSFLSNIRKPSICRSGVYGKRRETLLLADIDTEKQLRQKRAEEIKQLYFASTFLAGMKGRHSEHQKHIKDDLEMYPSEDEKNELETEEVHLQYTDAFREGNLLAKAFFDEHPPNRVRELCSLYYFD